MKQELTREICAYRKLRLNLQRLLEGPLRCRPQCPRMLYRERPPLGTIARCECGGTNAGIREDAFVEGNLDSPVQGLCSNHCSINFEDCLEEPIMSQFLNVTR